MKSVLKKMIYLFSILVVMFAVTSCGGDNNSGKPENPDSNKPTIGEWEMENGFGPVKTKLNLGQIDKNMVAEGEKIFESKCASCHKLDEKYAGPAQRNVLRRISPEFFINMVLNPDENIEKHPHIQELLAVYMLKMTNQNVTYDDARKLLEYFRKLDSELPPKSN